MLPMKRHSIHKIYDEYESTNNERSISAILAEIEKDVLEHNPGQFSVMYITSESILYYTFLYIYSIIFYCISC